MVLIRILLIANQSNGIFVLPSVLPQASYGHGGWFMLKRTSNCIFYQVGALIQQVLGYLVQGFGSFPTQISKFWGFGDTYGPTVPATDQLWTCGLVHLQEDVKLDIT